MPQSTPINEIFADAMPLDFASDYKPSTQSEKAYLSKLRWFSLIHAEIAPRLNAKREAMFKQYFCPEDKFIEESSEPKALFTLLCHK